MASNYKKEVVETKCTIESWTDSDGRLHRIDGPASITRTSDGIILCENWYKHGVYHRENGPAYSLNYENSTVFHRAWFYEGKLHHPKNEVTYSKYFGNGMIQSEMYYMHGELSRLNGPAVRIYDTAGYVIKSEYHICGCHLTLDQHELCRRWIKKEGLSWPFDKSSRVIFDLAFK